MSGGINLLVQCAVFYYFRDRCIKSDNVEMKEYIPQFTKEIDHLERELGLS